MKYFGTLRVLTVGMLSAAIVFSPNVAFAIVEGDQTPLADEEIAEAISSGEILGLDSVPTVIGKKQDYAVKTLGGSNRYHTSALEARSAFSSSQWIIVASGVGFADSICAAGLAGALSCPIVLTEPGQLTDSTAAVVRDLGVENVILLGSEKVASAAVYESLEQLVGAGNVTRLSGPTRYETQMAVYQFGMDNNLWNTEKRAVVASAAGFADALSISPVSYVLKAPVFYCNESGNLPADQATAIQSEWSNFLLAGSTVVTSSATEKYLDDIGVVKRLGGATRYETSRVINEYAVKECGFTWNQAALTSGSAPYDALGGGPLQGSKRSILALANDFGPKADVSSPLGGHSSSVTFLGDKAIFSMPYKTKAALAMGFNLSDIQGFRVYVDAGHGGSDPGASGCGYREANLTAELARKVSDRLRAKGIDSYVNLSGNHFKLRNPEAFNLNCGLLVSIHFNASGGRGVETYIHSRNAASGSAPLQRNIHALLVQSIGLPDRGMKQEQFAVCSGRVPATLLEVAFIDNRSDMNAYMGRKDQAAEAIASGIANL